MDVYEALRAKLDKHPAGCPPAPEIDEILRILFTEEEAKVALGLNFKPVSPETAAKRAGMDLDVTKKSLESLADKGMVFAKEKNGKMLYCLLPTMPGIFEFPFMKGEKSEELTRLAGLWHSYMGKLAQCFGSPSMAISRIIPIEEEVFSAPGVLPYERVYEMIDRAQAVGIAHCACRESENNCNAPREACMLFDDACHFLVARGFGRYITKDEMKRLLKEFDAQGLIHQVNNSQDRLTFICNCCTCCCGLLRAQMVHGNPNVFYSSGFAPELTADECIKCGICADRCRMKAITLEDGRPVFNLARCLGCGLCVTGCPEKALSLKRRTESKTPAPTNREMGLAILMEKGKLEDFLSESKE